MAAAASAWCSIFLSWPPRHQSNLWFESGIIRRSRIISTPISLSISSSTTIKTQQYSNNNNVTNQQDIVIVGGGIAGLATALSLHRLGVGSVVLEQAESLRTTGTSLTLFKNGWRVLDAIGVANDLRPQFLEIQGMAVKSWEDGRELRAFNFKQEDQSQEVRAVERRVLLETLASKLPKDSLRFSSKLANIQPTPNGDSFLRLVDGSTLLAKIVIGCDGIRSPIAKYMGFSEPKYSGHCAFRGLGYYPNGQPFHPKVTYIYGRGLRAGYVPVSSTKVYWFICFNSPSPPSKTTLSSFLKTQAKSLITHWPSSLHDIIDRSPDHTLSLTPLVDRWLWPAATPGASSGRVVVVGDAWHPMTPNLGQGACCALEDSVVLAKKLAGAINKNGDSINGNVSVEEAFKDYGSERWPRVFPLTVRANLVGSALQWDNPLVCALRDNLVIPKLVRLGPLLEHTNFTCDTL